MRHLVKDCNRSARLTRELGAPFTAYWDQENKNWVIYWREKKMVELVRGKKLEDGINEIKRAFYNVRNLTLDDNLKKARKIRDYRNDKDKEGIRDLCNETAKRLCYYTDKPMAITAGQREIILRPKRKKSFTFNHRKQK
jgi:hypothetical protein